MAATTKRKRVRVPAANAITHLSPDERRAKGRALRDQVSRASQAGWKPPRGRPDPIEILKGLERRPTAESRPNPVRTHE
jgi:hypothetical protein